MSIKIALAGNPNSGKTTLFNILTGSNQSVGNWPGVTVEKKEGRMRRHDGVTVTDLPGIYSLSPYTLEEVVARDYLVGEAPDAILNIIDGTNLERNLYLTTQLIELGVPVVIAINMIDVVRKRGDRIDIAKLSCELGCEIVQISALRGEGVFEAAEAAIRAAEGGKLEPKHIFSGTVEHALAHIEEAALHHLPDEQQRWYAIKTFERDARAIKQIGIPEATLSHIEADIAKTERELDDDAEGIIANERYNYITDVVRRCYRKRRIDGLTVSDAIDRVLTNRFAALPIFALIMFVVYFVSVTTVGTWITDWTNDRLFGELVPGWLGSLLDAANAPAWLSGLILDGIVAGVGAVLGFVPQMFLLFTFLAFLEECGYMARIAFVLDRIFRKLGLSGKSFIPMLIGTGCSVPGIMASRTIENIRDRRMTIMTTPFIPCGAKLPFIAMIAGTVFGGAWWVAPFAYFLGMAAVVISGLILKKTKPFEGEPTPFVMELPPYHLPLASNVLRSTSERSWSFMKKACTVILLSTIVIWFATYFGFGQSGFGMLSDEELDRSLLAYVGRGIAWIFIPLGFGSWQATVASLTGLVAKENIVSSLGILYSSGEMVAAFTKASGLSFLIFNLLCAPCFAAIGAIRREMSSGKWTWFAILYQCGFAYLIALIVNQLGSLFAGNGSILGTVAAVLCLAALIFMLVRPHREGESILGGIRRILSGRPKK